MNLSDILRSDFKILAGGEGSGCNPAAGHCGRPALGSPGKYTIPVKKKSTIAVWKELIKGQPVVMTGPTGKFSHFPEKKIAAIQKKIENAGKKYGWKLIVDPTYGMWQVKYHGPIAQSKQLGTTKLDEQKKQFMKQGEELAEKRLGSNYVKKTLPGGDTVITEKPALPWEKPSVKVTPTVAPKEAEQLVPMYAPKNVPISREKLNGIIDDYAKKVGGIENLKLPSYEDKTRWNNLVGLYKQVGMKEDDLQEHSSRIGGWSAKSNSAFAQLAQQAVYSKNYTSDEVKSMAIEYMVTQKILQKEHGDKVELYRGIGGQYATGAKQAAAEKTLVTLNTRGADSWTLSEKKARDFGDTVLKNTFPVKMIVTSWKSNDKLHVNHMSEKEYVVVPPGKELHLEDSSILATIAKRIKIDVSDDKNFNWLHSMRKKKKIHGGSYEGDIISVAKKNNYFRKVINTGKHSQLVVMCLKPGESIGSETHPGTDQTIVIVEGTGQAVLDHKKKDIEKDSVVVVPAGTLHNIKNTGSSPMKLYTTYSKKQHDPRTIHKTKADAIKDEGEEVHAGGPGSGRHKELSRIANKFRKNFGECEGKNMCSILSRQLSKHLEKEHGINNRVVNGYYKKGSSFIPHSWVRVGNSIVDPSADQFGKSKVVITDKKDSNYTKGKGMFAGGPGSGRHPYGRKPKEKDLERQKRALATYNPSTRIKRTQATENEKKLARVVGGASHIGDNQPFDVIVKHLRIAFEVKTKIDGRKNTITMHKESLALKMKAIKTMKLKAAYTVIFDDRPGENKIYVAKGLGSFRIRSKTGVQSSKLTVLKDISDIKKVIK